MIEFTEKMTTKFIIFSYVVAILFTLIAICIIIIRFFVWASRFKSWKNVFFNFNLFSFLVARLAFDFCLFVCPAVASYGPLPICNFELLNNQILFSRIDNMCEVELLLYDRYPKPSFHSTIKVIFHETIWCLKKMREIIEKASLKPKYLVVRVEDLHHLCHPKSYPSFHNQYFHDYILLLIERIVTFLLK